MTKHKICPTSKS